MGETNNNKKDQIWNYFLEHQLRIFQNLRGKQRMWYKISKSRSYQHIDRYCSLRIAYNLQLNLCILHHNQIPMYTHKLFWETHKSTWIINIVLAKTDTNTRGKKKNLTWTLIEVRYYRKKCNTWDGRTKEGQWLGERRREVSQWLLPAAARAVAIASSC